MLAEYLVGRRRVLDLTVTKASKLAGVNVGDVERGQGDEQQLVKLLKFYDNILSVFKKVDADNVKVLMTVKPEVNLVEGGYKVPSMTTTIFATLGEVYEFLQEYNNNVLRSWIS